MKSNAFHPILTLILILALLTSCKKSEVNNDLPQVTTSTITKFGDTYAIGGATIVAKGAYPVTARGFCWSTNHMPTVDNKKIERKAETIGDYTYEIDSLTNSTTYYVRAYAINGSGIGYGNEVTFTTLGPCPVVTSNSASNITFTTATLSGNISSGSGSDVTDRGFCWSTSPNPMVSDNKISLGTGLGDITTNMTGLTENTIYYVRAYATSSVGTGYGAVKPFGTNVKDVDQNVYNVVVIGDQAWLKQNLNVSHYRNGDAIPEVKDEDTWDNTFTGAYCYYNNDATLGQTYGKLYNWYAATDNRNISPQGWHIPSSNEFQTLINYLGDNAALKLEATSGLSGANSSGFTALPGGNRGLVFEDLNGLGIFWMYSTNATQFCIDFGGNYTYTVRCNPARGFSLRCLRD